MIFTAFRPQRTCEGPAMAVPFLLAGAAASAGGAIYQGIAAKQQGEYNASIAETNANRESQVQNYNAAADKINADRTMSDAAQNATIEDKRARAAIGAGVAQAGAGGLSIQGDTSTFGDVYLQNAVIEEQQKTQIFRNAQSQAAAELNQGSLSSSNAQYSLLVGNQQSVIDRSAGSNAFVGGFFGAAGAGFRGAGQVSAATLNIS